MKLSNTTLIGCYEIRNGCYRDKRGWFYKPFQDSVMKSLGLNFRVAELYFSSSGKNVIRGMHYQNPPKDHAKLVSCVKGHVFDVVMDIRRTSNTFGQCAEFTLKEGDGKSIYIPSGFAHGFCAIEDDSILSYLVSSEHSPEHDAGISWDGLGINWPTQQPIISDRDAQLPRFSTFQTPFR